MTRILGLVLTTWALLATPLWAGGADSLASAMAAMRAGDWDKAQSQAALAGSLGRDVIEWHRLRAGRGSASDVMAFIDRNPHWPGMSFLRKKSEPAFAGQSDSTVLAFFGTEPAQSARGALIHAQALRNSGKAEDADALLVQAWRTMPMKSATQNDYLAQHEALLRPHHAARLDRLLWDDHMVSSGRMLALVSDADRALAEARIGLRNRVDGVDNLIAKVPEARRNDPGLAHARFVWRARAGRSDDAIALLLEYSKSAETLKEPAAWAPRRRTFARSKMRAGDPKLAYRIASSHGLTEGSAFADLEWLSGYLALSKLGNPKTALAHFKRFDGAVVTPISKGRSWYWQGRAFEAMGDDVNALAAYSEGAKFQTSFYGLLAAEKAGVAFDPSLANPPEVPNWRDAGFSRSDVLETGLLLLAAGELNLAERFLTHLTEVLNETEAAQMGNLALELGQPHLAVMVAKRAAGRAVVVPGAYYPLHPLTDLKLPMAPEMNLAIARRESEFDPVVISHAGARGLMQVMPATAQNVANKIGTSGHSTGRLTSDWKYNALLGANYLSGLAGEFNGNVVMMSAGYNAGPHRPERWMAQYGDPRRGDMDIVDWIEHIPFNETRNYVMRVTESLPVYRARLGKDPLPIPFSQELAGSTLRAFAP